MTSDSAPPASSQGGLIPASAQQLPPALEMWRSVLALEDLQVKGDPGRWMRLLSDFIPVYALLAGLSEVGPKILSLTPAGAARVANVGSGLTHIEPHEGTAGAGATVTVIFGQTISHVVLAVDDAIWTCQTSVDGVSYDPAFTMYGGERYPMDLTVLACKVTNTATTPARYRVHGFYFLPTPASH
jgi:hypothetical protein